MNVSHALTGFNSGWQGGYDARLVNIHAPFTPISAAV
jgi:hypothetical protein